MGTEFVLFLTVVDSEGMETFPGFPILGEYPNLYSHSFLPPYSQSTPKSTPTMIRRAHILGTLLFLTRFLLKRGTDIYTMGINIRRLLLSADVG